jgi:hypothetical protein
VTVSGHSATNTGQLNHAFILARPAITLGPVRIKPAATPDWQKAFRACFGPTVGCVTTGNATVALATANGPSGFPSGSGNLFDQSVVFVITWDPAPCVKFSAPRCRVVDIIPTKTYSLTYAFEIGSTVDPPIGSK